MNRSRLFGALFSILLFIGIGNVYAAANVTIIDVDKGVEFVDIRNSGDQTAWMNGWELVSQNGNQRCDLGGSIPAGRTMRVYAQEGWVPDYEIWNCNFDGLIWNNSKTDPAILCNSQGQEVSRFPVGANSSDPEWSDVGCENGAAPAPNPPANPPAQGEPCPDSGAWPPGCVPGGSPAPNPPPANPPANPPAGQPCPDSGPWPAGCVPGGAPPANPPASPPAGGAQPCPESGPWPAGCVPGGAPPASPPPANPPAAGQPCPESGVWPPGCVVRQGFDINP